MGPPTKRPHTQRATKAAKDKGVMKIVIAMNKAGCPPTAPQMDALKADWQPSFDAEESLARVLMILISASCPATAGQCIAIEQALDADI
jgi:hypothetical protein